MQIQTTPIANVLVIEPRVFHDDRGWFCETWQAARYVEAGIPYTFVQDNQAYSKHAVLRGLHYQIDCPQGKLVRVLSGEIFDVAVDLRQKSPTFGQWYGIRLSAENRRQLFVPPEFAHGYCVLSESADVAYKTTDYYSPSHERTILWNDPTIGITWPISNPMLSSRDAAAMSFADAPKF